MKFACNFFCFLLVTGLFLSSCKKKEENPAPVISILKPASGSAYKPGDTLFIEATISDDEPLSSVSIKLLNANYIPADHSESVSISGTSYHLTYSYIIQNNLLTSGDYYITLSVSDGTNDENEYRSIIVHEIPRTRKAIYVITQPDSLHLDVSKLDSSGALIPLFNVPGDYAGSAINSRDLLLLTLGKYRGGFNQFDLRTNVVNFSVPAYNFPLPSFQYLFFHNGQTFISYYGGYIEAFDINGQVKFNSDHISYFIPDALCVNDQYVFAEGYFSSVTQNRIIVFFKSSSAERQICNVSCDIVSMISLDDNHIMVFGNENGDGKILTYDVFLNGTNLLQTINSILFYKVISIDADNYALATDKGLYRYVKSTNSFLPVDLTEPVYNLEFDEVNGILFAGSGRKIKEYLFPSSSVLNTVITTDSVAAVRVLYTK